MELNMNKIIENIKQKYNLEDNYKIEDDIVMQHLITLAQETKGKTLTEAVNIARNITSNYYELKRNDDDERINRLERASGFIGFLLLDNPDLQDDYLQIINSTGL